MAGREKNARAGSGETGSSQSEENMKPLETVWKELDATESGLSSEEAETRVETYGYNEIEEERKNPILKFLSYFWGPIPWMIEVAAVLSVVVGHWADFGVIGALLVVNGLVGFWEEHQADNTIQALKDSLALEARVKRDGEWKSVNARELVPGDVVRLRIGNVIPADVRYLDDDPVQVDQSALTGESLPVTREHGAELYSGSILKRGEGDALVYATGENTYFGQTASLMKEGNSRSHFQKAVVKVGDYLIVLALSLVILILGVALFRGEPMLTTVQFALILTVAAIPVAMPTILSVTMAVGARILAAKNAIVSHLSSVEELAGMDVLCADKTGTLTMNELTLGDPVTARDVDAGEVVRAAALASREEGQDPIDLAILKGLDENDVEGYSVEHFTPFDPVSKRTEAEIKDPDGNSFKTSKGAPQVILQLAETEPSRRKELESQIDELASRGYRALGVAKTDGNDTWQVLGVLPLYDPPREDSRETIDTAREMGINVKMVTGDQVAIGKEIAKQVDLKQNILDADILENCEQHMTTQLENQIESADGFGQVFPEHKYHIVDVLQRRKHIVGMTGDGVNDAPALRKADVGIAVSGATDAARSASDIVLLDKGLSVIVSAVKEARKIFQRMQSYAIYRITETIRVLLFMTLSILVFNFYPVTAIMIVLLALLNDGAILSIAFDNVVHSDKPESWDLPGVLGIATVLGIVGVIESFGLFYVAERVLNLDQGTIQTLMYLKLSVAGHLTIFAARTRGPFWSVRPSWILVAAVFGTQAVATLISVYGLLMAPLGWPLALLVWGYAGAFFFLLDGSKLIAYRIMDRERSGMLDRHPDS